MTAPALKTSAKPETARGITRWVGQVIVSLVLFGALLFLAAGRLDWVAGWAFLGLNALTQLLSAAVLIPRRPELLAERTAVRAGTKGFDRFFAPALMVFGPLAVIITAGLDTRFDWSASTSGFPLGSSLWGLGLALAFCSQAFVLWAMASNPFFALTVRIQDERGHGVVSSGPYRIVRHPGYLGSVLYNLVVPLALGSLWTYVPALLTIGLLAVRTGLEDRTLRAELPGYPEYTSAVRYRLIPGVW
jgi:protein-S-isoprenylcysteine O-methyltransferase Ste14